MRVTGSCHCGQIAYEAEVDPETVRVCHCTDCHKTGGGAFSSNVSVKPGTLKFIRGTPAIYIKTTADSGNKRAHGFCPVCATRVYAGSVEGEPARYSLRLGTLDQRRALPPKAQIWCASALPWATNIPGTVKKEKQ